MIAVVSDGDGDNKKYNDKVITSTMKIIQLMITMILKTTTTKIVIRATNQYQKTKKKSHLFFFSCCKSVT